MRVSKDEHSALQTEKSPKNMGMLPEHPHDKMVFSSSSSHLSLATNIFASSLLLPVNDVRFCFVPARL